MTLRSREKISVTFYLILRNHYTNLNLSNYYTNSNQTIPIPAKKKAVSSFAWSDIKRFVTYAISIRFSYCCDYLLTCSLILKQKNVCSSQMTIRTEKINRTDRTNKRYSSNGEEWGEHGGVSKI